MLTDVHCHHVPPAYLRFVEARSAEFGTRWTWLDAERAELVAGGRCFAMSRDFLDPGWHLSQMDQLGIEVRVLSLATPLINYAVRPPLAAEGARIVNDELAALKAAYPGRFEAWAYLPMQSPEAAAEELGRAVRDLGLGGGHVSTNVGGRYLDDPAFSPVFEAAVRLDVPLFIHPSNPPGQDRLGRYELAVVSGYLFDTTINVFNMIFGGLLDRYPTLRLCCTHAGGYALSLRGRMQREVDTNPALAARIKHPVGHYLRRLYYDTVCFEPDYLRYAIQVAGADRFILGSDAPFPLGEPDALAFVRAACQDADTADRILRENFKEMTKKREASS